MKKFSYYLSLVLTLLYSCWFVLNAIAGILDKLGYEVISLGFYYFDKVFDVILLIDLTLIIGILCDIRGAVANIRRKIAQRTRQFSAGSPKVPRPPERMPQVSYSNE